MYYSGNNFCGDLSAIVASQNYYNCKNVLKSANQTQSIDKYMKSLWIFIFFIFLKKDYIFTKIIFLIFIFLLLLSPFN